MNEQENNLSGKFTYTLGKHLKIWQIQKRLNLNFEQAAKIYKELEKDEQNISNP